MTFVSNLEDLVLFAKRFAKSFLFFVHLILLRSKMMDNITLPEDFKGHKWMKVQANIIINDQWWHLTHVGNAFWYWWLCP